MISSLRQLAIPGLVAAAALFLACAPAAPPAPTTAPAKPAAQATTAPAPPATAAPAAQPTAAPAAKPPGQPARVEYIQATDSPTYMFYYAAKAKSFFTDQGLDVPEAVRSRASAASVQAIAAGPGSAVIGGVTPDSAIIAIDKQAPLKIVAASTNLPPYGLIVRPEIQGAADLKGQNCGASNIVSGEAPFLKALIKNKYGLTYPADYNLIVIGAIQDRSAGLLAGAVKCLTITPPQNLDLVSRGMKEVANAARGDAFPDYQFLTVIVNTNWAKDNRSALVRTLKAFSDAQEWVFQNYDKPDTIQMAIKDGLMPEPFAAEALKIYYGPGSKVQSHLLKPSIKGLEAVVEFMKADGTFPKDQKPDWKKYLDMSYWEEATGQKFEY